MSRHFTEPKITPDKPNAADMGKDWFVWFRIYDPVAGRWVQKSYKKGINTFHTYRERLAEANALRAALLEELQAGWNPLEPAPTLRPRTVISALDSLYELKAQNVRPKTRETYRHIAKLLKDWLTDQGAADMPLDSFTAVHAQQYLDQLVMTRGYAGRTHNDHLTILSTFFNAFVERSWTVQNPFKKVRKMQTTVGRNLAYSEAERLLLRDTLKREDQWMYYFTQIMYFCFIRRTELTRLRVADFDLQNHTIVIRAQASKNKTQESVVIPRGLEPVLREMGLRNYPPDHYVFGRHLFPSDRPYSNPDHISARHNKFVKRLGIDPEKGLYSWKHTGVVAAYHATGKDVYSVMRQLRHRSLETTMIYLKSMGLIQNDVFRQAMG